MMLLGAPLQNEDRERRHVAQRQGGVNQQGFVAGPVGALRAVQGGLIMVGPASMARDPVWVASQKQEARWEPKAVSTVDALLQKWGRYCEGLFRDLVVESSTDLAHLVVGAPITAGLPPHLLTFAAEILGLAHDSKMVVATLLPLLSHESALVREGAIYGLAQHLTPEVQAELRRLVKRDPSQGVRLAAATILDD